MKNFIIMFTLILSVTFVSNASSYTYDGEIDPDQFFKYSAVETEQVSQHMFVVSLKSDSLKPRYAINAVYYVGDKAMIIAYAYFAMTGEFKHFMLNRETLRYEEVVPNPKLKDMLLDKLDKLNKLFTL